MENILKMGYAIEVKYKDGSVYTKYFGIKQLQKATNYFNKMNNSIDKNVYKVMSKIAQVSFQDLDIEQIKLRTVLIERELRFSLFLHSD